MKPKHHMIFALIVFALLALLFMQTQRAALGGAWGSIKAAVDPGAKANGSPATGNRRGSQNAQSPSMYDNGTGVGTSSSYGVAPIGGAGGNY